MNSVILWSPLLQDKLGKFAQWYLVDLVEDYGELGHLCRYRFTCVDEESTLYPIFSFLQQSGEEFYKKNVLKLHLIHFCNMQWVKEQKAHFPNLACPLFPTRVNFKYAFKESIN